MKTQIQNKKTRPIEMRETAAVRYQTQIVNPDGSIASKRDWKNNLILDQGLNLHAYYNWADCFQYAAVGTGTTPVKWDSGTTTFSRSGTTVTASANIFSSGDVGRLLKFDTGEEMYITAYTDPVTVTVNISGTLGASEGTIWGVNQTALVTELKRTNTYGSGGGDNGTSYNSGTGIATLQRTFLFSAESGAVTYREVGWSTSSSGNLFGRDLIPGVGDSLVAGQQYKIIVQILLSFAPTSPVAVSDVGSGGYNTAGTLMLESVSRAYSKVNTSGGTDGNFEIGEPTINRGAGVITATWTQQSTPSGSDINLTVETGTGAKLGYTNGNFYNDFTQSFSVSQVNKTHYGLTLHSFGGLVATTLKFTTPQTKDSSHTLSYTYRMSWGRVLSNT